MDAKKVLMIHEVREWMFDLPLHEYVLTFDDGLYGQYYYLDKFLEVDTEKYFFISTEIVCPEELGQSQEFPDCREAHQHFFQSGSKEHYMKWSQIKQIAQSAKCFIGGHSHSHRRRGQEKISSLYADLITDTEKMFSEFEKHQIQIDSFCFPYNEEHLLYRELLKKKGIKKFFGNERVAIENLKSIRD